MLRSAGLFGYGRDAYGKWFLTIPVLCNNGMYVYCSYILYCWRCLQMSVRVQVIIEEEEAQNFFLESRKKGSILVTSAEVLQELLQN